MKKKANFSYIEKKQCLNYRYSYKGTRISVYGKTEKECREKAKAKEELIDRHCYVNNRNITLSEYYREWQENRVLTIKKSSQRANNEMWARIEPHLGKLKIADIEKRHITHLQVLLNKRLSTAGVNLTIALLDTILRSAVNDRIIIYNPCTGVKNLKRTEPKATDTNHRALTVEEQELFFRYAKERSWYYELFAFMVSTGCRLGEAAALTWKDIDRKNNVIHITKTLSRVSDSEFEISLPKTDTSIRDIPLTKNTLDILQQQREKCEMFRRNNVISINDRVFRATKEGSEIRSAMTNQCIRALLQGIETHEGVHIEPFGSHAFRATFATRAIEQGMNPQTLKTILGHKNLSVTMDLYAHVLPNTKQEEMRALEIVV